MVFDMARRVFTVSPENVEVPQEHWHLSCEEEEGLEAARSSPRACSFSEEAPRRAAWSWGQVLAGLALSASVFLVAAAASFHGVTPGPAALRSLGNMSAADKYDFCASRDLPELWKPRDLKPGKKPLHVRVLTYNLFWWHLFRIKNGSCHGEANTSGRLVAGAHAEHPFDLMGFQECEDQTRVLHDAGLLSHFGTIRSPENKCMAYRRDHWKLLSHGHEDVGVDVAWQYYGRRGAGWMRLLHKPSGATVLFMNHHGPLNVNSGGVCGGNVTARNLAYVALKHGKKGDVVILTGDFNSGPPSDTIRELSKLMTNVYNGSSYGGVDNFFTNLPNSSAVARKNLGGAGSDHDALSVTFVHRHAKKKKATADGWVVGATNESCDAACGTTGRLCTEQGLYQHNSDVDSQAELEAIAGISCTFTYNTRFLTASDVPSIGAYGDDNHCTASGSDRSLSTFSCARVPANNGKRMCYCSQEEKTRRKKHKHNKAKTKKKAQHKKRKAEDTQEHAKKHEKKHTKREKERSSIRTKLQRKAQRTHGKTTQVAVRLKK